MMTNEVCTYSYTDKHNLLGYFMNTRSVVNSMLSGPVILRSYFVQTKLDLKF